MDRYIGFDGTDSMARAAATAGVVLTALVGLRVRPTVTLVVLMRLRCNAAFATPAYLLQCAWSVVKSPLHADLTCPL